MSNKIGRFEIVSEIAHCDTSSVYKATDTESKQTVALKVIRLEPLGEQKPALLKTILDEAEASKVLNSHNIALLYGAGEIDGNLCASLEYVQGNSVATMLARKEGFSIWDLQDIARQACQGLDHAHVRKVFHYGLEPAKIMVQWDGIVKILGFGVSSTGQFAAQATGTPSQILHYMSPEQLNGDPVDARSNLFSLGAILYEMVTERKAFGGETADEVRQAILESTPTPIDQINRKVHPALKAVIAKALAKAPEERFQSGQELVNDLEKCKESAVKASTPAKASAKPAGKPVQAPAAQAALSRAAAAGRGTGTTSTSAKSSSTPPPAPDVSVPAANMSAAVSDEPEVQTPRIAVDPMMNESKQAGSGGPSFSEIDELPPLKEVYVAPASPPPPQETEPDDAVKAVVFNRAAVSKPKAKPADVAKNAAEVAKKAVGEIKQTPPQMFIYSIAAAAAVILLVVAGIAYHIHSGESDDQSVPAPAKSAAATPSPAAPVAQSPQPAQTAEPAPAPVEVPQQITPEPPVEEAPPVSVTPKHETKVSKKKGKTAKPAPSIVPGQLSIDSNPQGAQIAIDGKNAASTPSNIAALLPGHHTITISKAGYATETRAIDVTSGSKSVISIQLAPTTATVAATTDPVGATVWIDGRNTGRTTPLQLSVDKPGNHTFVFKKQGYLDETANANVQIGQTLQLAPTLRPLGVTDEIKVGGRFKKVFGGSETAGMGTVSVKTQPKGAQVAVNSRVVDKPSPVEFYLNPGNYIIDITMSGFKSVEKVVTVEKNGKVVIDESMDRE